MAAIDAFNTFSGGFNAAGAVTYQTVTGASPVVSTNSFDTTGASPSGQNIDLGKGEEMDLVIQVGTAFTGLTALECQLVQADDAALTTNVEVITSSGAVAVANLGAGKQIVVPVGPVDPKSARRYVGVRYVPTGTGTAGTVFGAFQRRHGDVPQPVYKSGFAIL